MVKFNERLTKQVAQLSAEKNDILTKNMLLESYLDESAKIQGNLRGELKHMKKQVRMLNSTSSKCDQILTVGKAVRDRVGLGYTSASSRLKTMFVQASRAEKPEVVRKNAGSYSETRIGTPTRKWISTCHYCERIGYIQPRCY